MGSRRMPRKLGRLSLAVGLVASLAILLAFLATLSVSAADRAESPQPIAAAVHEMDAPATPEQQRPSPFWSYPHTAVRIPPDDGLEPLALPGLRLRVNQDHDWVDGRTSPNATVWITATDSLGTIKGATQTTARGDGHFDGISLQDNVGQQVDLAPGDTVVGSSSDGSEASVAILTMTGAVDATANTISGQIIGGVFPALARGEVWAEDGPTVYGTVDATGHYLVDFNPYDLQADSDIFLTYHEPDGDSVGIVRHGFTLVVNSTQDWVETTYEAGYTIWITVTDGNGAVKATTRGTTGQIPWWSPGQFGYSTILGDWQPTQPDLAPGDWVYGTLSTGETRAARMGTITGNLDIVQDRVSGTITAAWFAQPLQGSCTVWEPGAPPSIDFSVAPNGGAYHCDLGAAGWDLRPGQQIAVAYFEPDRDQVLQVFREPIPDLAVDKHGMANPAAGGNYVYRIFYHNRQDGAASNVQITDTLPAGMSYLADTAGFPHTIDGSQVIWDLGTIAGNAHDQFEVFVQVDGGVAAGTPLTNVVEITTPEFDADPGNNSYTWWTTTVDPDVQVNVGKYAQTMDPVPGQNVIFVVNACNQGATGSRAVTLSDTLPPSLTLRSWWGQYPGWTEVVSEAHHLVVTRPSLPGGWCSEVYVRARLDASLAPDTVITNSAWITASDDLNVDDNETQWEGRVGLAPHTNLHIEKSWLWGSLIPGGSLNYEFGYGNSGNVPVADVLITETLPTHTRFVRAWRLIADRQIPVMPTVVADGYVVWDLGVLGNGYSGLLGVEVRIDDDLAPGALLTHTAEISLQPFEDSDFDNRAVWVDVLNDLGPNLRVEKRLAGWPGGSHFQWELRVLNMGSEPLEGIWVADAYPISTTNPGWSRNHGPTITATHDAPNHRMVFWLERLAGGETASLNFWVDVEGSAVGVRGLAFTNTLTAPLPNDVYPEDNTDEAVAYSGPDLAIVKGLSGDAPRPGELLTYTLRFANVALWRWKTEGTVWVTDTLPAGMEFVSARQRFCDPGVYYCTRDPDRQEGQALAWSHGANWHGGAWNEMVITARVASAQAGAVLTNRAEIASDNANDVEPDYNNNASEVAVVVAGSQEYLPLICK